MNRHQRRKAGSSLGAAVKAFVDKTVLLDAPDVPTVGVGPIVWSINANDGRNWYFVCASADHTGRFHLDCLKTPGDDRSTVEQAKTLLLAELVNHRPLVIHDFDDEQQFASFCAAVWPSERTRQLQANVAADYAEREDA